MPSVPAYTMAPHAETLKLLRVVVREDFSLQRAQIFLRGNLEKIMEINRINEANLALQICWTPSRFSTKRLHPCTSIKSKRTRKPLRPRRRRPTNTLMWMIRTPYKANTERLMASAKGDAGTNKLRGKV